ncbi:MAG: hypothetical protein AAF587_37870 [Bacteroidota bacterium]
MILLFVCAWGQLFSQNLGKDTQKLLQPARLQAGVNTANSSLSLPSLEDFLNQQTFHSVLLPTTLEDFSMYDSFQSASAYAGLMINFLFDSKLFGQTEEVRKNFFTLGFEAGVTTIEMYRLASSDTTGLSYTSTANQFRITVGFRRLLTKRDRRFTLYSGLEYVNEINISAVLWERQRDVDFTETLAERKLFSQKTYNGYLNMPLGLEIRLSKKIAFLTHINLGVGSQKIDPFRLTDFYAGLRMGLSFHL